MSALPPKTATFFDPKQETEVNRRKMIAQQLSQNAADIPLGNEMVSGIVVKRSPIEGLSKALQMGLGGYAQGQAMNKEAELEGNRSQNMQRALEAFGNDPQAAAAILGQDPRTAQMAMELMGNEVSYGREKEMDALNYQREESRFERELAMKRQAMEMDALSKASELTREDQRWEKDAALKRELVNLKSQSGGSYVDPDTGEVIQGFSNKPLPVGALKLQGEAVDAIGAASGVSDLTGQLIGQVDAGQLELNPVSNFLNRARNFTGFSNDQSVNFANMKTSLEKLRNDTLRLNKGVQTEGDAVRAMNEVLQSVNDPQVFRAAMEKLAAVNDRAAELQKVQVNTIRQNYNAAPFDFDQLQGLPSPVAPSANITPQGGDKRSQAAQYLASKGMAHEQIESYLQSKGM